MPTVLVQDLEIGAPDPLNDLVREIYGRKTPDYGVYSTGKRVSVLFADDKAAADKQRGELARLNPLRGEINGLIDGWRNSRFSRRRTMAARYDRRVADALVVAFEADITGAELLLTEIKRDLVAERVAWARFLYLLVTLGCGIAAVLLFSILAWIDNGLVTRHLWHAAQGGTLGAFFSIALGIRSRTILPDLQWLANGMDAALRVTIGVIAAVVLSTFVLLDLVKVLVDGRTVTSTPGGLIDAGQAVVLSVFLIGFIAGFSERLVPDLLGKASIKTTPEPQLLPNTSARPLARKADADGQPAAKLPTQGAADPDPVTDDDRADRHVDACMSGLDIHDDEVTEDVDLPPATGGVAPKPAIQGVTP